MKAGAACKHSLVDEKEATQIEFVEYLHSLTLPCKLHD